MIFIKDSEFIRGNCPMTKEDIRILSVSKLNLNSNSRVLDIGSGTGTISIQSAKFSENGIVYSIEKDEDAFNTTLQNIKKFNCTNIKANKGEALEYINSLSCLYDNKPFLDSIFIGGSGGNLEEILEKCNEMLKENGVMVMNFITLNNAYKAMEVLRKLNFSIDVSLVNISKNRVNTYMMIANNPIYIIQCIKKGEI